ncbi:MAG: T9SS type A sorting domain-containing protein [Cyclobacteriaceae bacterium]
MNNMIRRGFSYFSLFTSLLGIAAQERPIGANLTDLSPFGTIWIYTNALKQSSSWLIRNANDDNDAINGSSELRNHLAGAFDEFGYPLQVPFTIDSLNETVGKNLEVSSFVLTNQPEPYLYPSGTYLLVFEGTGNVRIQGDVDGEVMFFSEAGEYEVPISNPTSLGVEIFITSSMASDPIRDVRLIFPEYTETYQTTKFRSDFIELAQNFEALRYMKPMRSENNNIENWADRTLSENFSFFLDVEDDILIGMPFEDIIELSNLSGVDPWISVPYKVNDEFVTNVAHLFDTLLNVDRTLYMEYGNEAWNPSYPTTHQYMLDQGNLLNLGTHENAEVAELQAVHRFYARRMFEVIEIFNDVFDDDSRVVKIHGTQSDAFVADLVFEAYELPDINPNDLRPDAIAPASYIGVSMFDDFANQGLEVCDHSAQDLLDSLIARIDREMEESLAAFSTQSAAEGIALFAYEGGQHVTEINFQPMTACAEQRVADMNRLPGMEDFFCQLFDTWYDTYGGELIMLFNLAERPDPFGSFGLLESQWQELSESNKWSGLENCVLDPTVDPPLGLNTSSMVIYPNPSKGDIHLDFGVMAKDVQVELLDIGGNVLTEQRFDSVQRGSISTISHLNSGIYFLKIWIDGVVETRRIQMGGR